MLGCFHKMNSCQAWYCSLCEGGMVVGPTPGFFISENNFIFVVSRVCSWPTSVTRGLDIH